MRYSVLAVVCIFLASCGVSISQPDLISLKNSAGNGGGGTPPATGSPIFVSKISAGLASANPVTLLNSVLDTTLGSPNLIVACVATYDTVGGGGTASTTFSDSLNNTWQSLPLQHTNAAPVNLQMYYAFNPSLSANQTFNANGGNGFASMAVMTFSGVAGTFDQHKGASTTSTLFAQPGAITAPNTPALFVTCIGGDSQTPWTSVGVDSGFTIPNGISQTAGAGGSPEEISAAYLIDSSGSSINPKWTIAGESDGGLVPSTVGFATVMATFL